MEAINNFVSYHGSICCWCYFQQQLEHINLRCIGVPHISLFKQYNSDNMPRFMTYDVTSTANHKNQWLSSMCAISAWQLHRKYQAG